MKRRLYVVIRIGIAYYGIVGRRVILRIVVCRYEILLDLRGLGRIGILGKIAIKHVYRLVETAASQLELQLAVIEQCAAADFIVHPAARSYRKRLHGPRLVARFKVAVRQVVAGILRQCIVGAAHLGQIRCGVAVIALLVERKARYVILAASHVSALGLVFFNIPVRPIKVGQMKPRLGQHAQKFDTALGRSTCEQLVAIAGHILVIAVRELQLQKVIRHHIGIGAVGGQRGENLPCPPVVSAHVIHIADIIAGMRIVAAFRRHVVQPDAGGIPVFGIEIRMPRLEIVLVPALGVQSVRVHGKKTCERTFVIPLIVQQRTLIEAHLIAPDRVRIFLRECSKSVAGIPAPEFDSAQGAQKIRFAAARNIVGIQMPFRLSEFVFGSCPLAVTHQFACTAQRSVRTTNRKGSRQKTEDTMYFTHNRPFYIFHKNTNFYANRTAERCVFWPVREYFRFFGPVALPPLSNRCPTRCP